MPDTKTVDTIVILKPDSFWRGLKPQVQARIKTLGLTLMAEVTLAGTDNLSKAKWEEFYFPSIGSRPAVLDGTSRYMAFGPVHVMHLKGEDAIVKVRRLVGATRPWQAEPGTIRGDFWPGADLANAPYQLKLQPPGSDPLLFNLIHASDSEASFAREILFFTLLTAAPQ